MPQRKRKSGTKFRDKPRQIKDNGVRVDLGGVEEFTWHCRWQFHRLLEQLINDPFAPNHLDHIADGQPELRDALRKRELAGLTREQLWAKRDEYVARLEAGEEPYSSKLIRSGWLDDDGQMIDSQTGEVIPFVPVGSAN